MHLINIEKMLSGTSLHLIYTLYFFVCKHLGKINHFSAEEYYSEELILKNRLNQLKKEEQDVQYEREKLSSLRSLHIRYVSFSVYSAATKYFWISRDLQNLAETFTRIFFFREMKRIQYEDVSKYRNNIELNGRYLLLNLIGKGGFSEVYKAYDYQDQMMVAIKIHQINPEWPEQKKSDYQKWVLIHPKIPNLELWY